MTDCELVDLLLILINNMCEMGPSAFKHIFSSVFGILLLTEYFYIAVATDTFASVKESSTFTPLNKDRFSSPQP